VAEILFDSALRTLAAAPIRPELGDLGIELLGDLGIEPNVVTASGAHCRGDDPEAATRRANTRSELTDGRRSRTANERSAGDEID
jgi:hypothetical protein